MEEICRHIFPEGTVSIAKEEMQMALSNFEVIEIPGTVRELCITADATKDVRTNEIVLKEGTVSIKNSGSQHYKINITSTLMEVEGFEMPRVSCLPLSFRRAYHVSGIEYLQAYPQADVRYPWDDRLKHFVLLGDELPYIVQRFEHVPDGCVIHVESVGMAEKVLKQVDADNIYVIPDADEWRNFPEEKLNLTFDEYNPEARLTAKQIEIRKENQAKRDAEEAKRQEKKRQEGKEQSIRKMVEPIIVATLDSLLGPQESVIDWRYQETLSKYSVKVTEGKMAGESIVQVKATIANGLSIDYNYQYQSKDLSSYAVVLCFAATEFPKAIGLMAAEITKVRDFVDEHRETINQYHLIPGDEKFRPECPAPGVVLPFMDKVIVGCVEMESIERNVAEIKAFVSGLEGLIIDARKVFPLGFGIVAVEK